MTAPAPARRDFDALLAELGRRVTRRSDSEGITPGKLALNAGVASQHGWNAAHARAVPADAWLKLCDHLGLDPATCEPIADGMPALRGPIAWTLVATCIHGRILTEKLTVREVATAAGVSPATVTRACQARVISLGSLLALSAWCGRHIHEVTLGLPS